jgi:phosphoribosylanthranilate isomerase
VIRAFRSAGADFSAVERYLSECERLSASPQSVLVDAFQPGIYGGSGARADWQVLGTWRHQLRRPLILAGGLTPENVAEAIAAVRPAAVDVASGVESAPGQKEPAKVREFVMAAKKALAGLDGTWT